MKIIFSLLTRTAFKALAEYVYIFSYLLAFTFFIVYDFRISEITVLYAYIIMQIVDCFLPLRPVQSIVPLFAPRSAINRWYINFLYDSLTPSVVVLYALFNIFGVIYGYGVFYYAMIFILHIHLYSVRVYLGYNFISPIPILLLTVSIWMLLYHDVYWLFICVPFIIVYLINSQSALMDVLNKKVIYIKGFSFYQRDSVINAVGVASILTLYWFISSQIGLEHVSEFYESATMMLILSPIVFFVFIYNNCFGYYSAMWYEYQLVYNHREIIKRIVIIVLPIITIDYLIKITSIYILNEAKLVDLIILSKYYIYYSIIFIIISIYSSLIYPKYIPEKLLEKRGGLLSSLLFLLLGIVFVIGSKYSFLIVSIIMFVIFLYLKIYVHKRRFELHYRAVRTLKI